MQPHSFAREEHPTTGAMLEMVAQGVPNHGSEGLQSFLAASQKSNPVTRILGFDSHIQAQDHIVPGTNSPANTDSYLSSGAMFPIVQSNGNRYAKVEQIWHSRMSNQGRWPGEKKRWYDVLKGVNGNLFNAVPAPAGGIRKTAGMSEDCRLRMRNSVYAIGSSNNPFNPASAFRNTQVSVESTQARFPACESFNAALDKYFKDFTLDAPFLHMPTFSIATCHPLLLFTMSCVGFKLQKTKEGSDFVACNFGDLRDRIQTELDNKLTSTTTEAMSIFATTFIFLKLAAMISDRDHLSPCQLLEISLLSLAQMHGMFTQYGDRASLEAFLDMDSLEERWMAWSRVESLKRISVSLMRLDSAYATFVKSAPVIQVAGIEVMLPCDDQLFAAPTAEKWQALIQNSNMPITMPSICSSVTLERLRESETTFLDYYSMHAVLNYLQLRSLDATQKLLNRPYCHLVPCTYYLTEDNLRDFPLHVVAFADSYQSLSPRPLDGWQRTNYLVFWHFLCLSLTMNQDIFEKAAGREGHEAQRDASTSIVNWSVTAAARRALLHATAIFTLLSDTHSTTQSEKNSLYAAFATFTAGLVMTWYTFAEPNPPNSDVVYELTSDVQWQGFGLIGLDPSLVHAPASDAQSFVLNGGACVFNGRVLRGIDNAQNMLKIYAKLLEKCGRYNYTQMSKVLIDLSAMLDIDKEQRIEVGRTCLGNNAG